MTARTQPGPGTGDLAARIRAGMVAFCAGDALGVPWEGRPPAAIASADLDSFAERREDWPRGSTSDDTDQMLLVAEVLVEEPTDLPRRFLELLSERLPTIRGAGPSTEAAVERFRATGALRADGGTTNGAAMRALPLGWAGVSPEVVEALTVTTHATPAAVAAARAIAAMGDAALRGDDPLAARSAAAGGSATARYSPGPAGVSLDAAETVAAVRHVVAAAPSAADAMRAAVRLGGDTDTVAALAGGILGCRAGEPEPPWLEHVVLPDPALLDRLADGLARLRSGRG